MEWTKKGNLIHYSPRTELYHKLTFLEAKLKYSVHLSRKPFFMWSSDNPYDQDISKTAILGKRFPLKEGENPQEFLKSLIEETEEKLREEFFFENWDKGNDL